MKVIILKGLPGSGKTTEATKMVEASQGKIKRINKDDLRDMADSGKWSKTNEAFILAMRDRFIHAALEGGYDVVVDDTNLDPRHEKRIRQIASQYDAQVEVKFVDTPVEECIRRDAERPEGRRCGEKVIRGMYEQYLKNQEKKEKIVKIEPPKYDPNLPFCIICDIDGTLALMNGRNAYDHSRCEEDLLNIPIASILGQYYNFPHPPCSIILVSGREEKFREQTERWLKRKSINYYKNLFMRPTDDKRRDNIIKQEIYEREIKGKYNVLFVLDDRQRVVDMWREQGLVCLQVAEGDF